MWSSRQYGILCVVLFPSKLRACWQICRLGGRLRWQASSYRGLNAFEIRLASRRLAFACSPSVVTALLRRNSAKAQ
jgi:hypothetical protein